VDIIVQIMTLFRPDFLNKILSVIEPFSLVGFALHPEGRPDMINQNRQYWGS
jgi:hypothetical protein